MLIRIGIHTFHVQCQPRKFQVHINKICRLCLHSQKQFGRRVFLCIGFRIAVVYKKRHFWCKFVLSKLYKKTYHPIFKKIEVWSTYFFDKIPFRVFLKNLDLNHFVHLNSMGVTIFINKFMDSLHWLDLKTTSDIALTSFYLIDDKIGAWYEYIEK